MQQARLDETVLASGRVDGMDDARPLIDADLQQLPAFAEQVQALDRCVAPVTLYMGGCEYLCRWDMGQGAGGKPHGLEVAVRLGEWRLVLKVGAAGGGFGPLGLDLDVLAQALAPVALRTMVMEACADAVQAIEHATGLRVSIDGVWLATDQAGQREPPGLGWWHGLVLRETSTGQCTPVAVAPLDAEAGAAIVRLCAGWSRGAPGGEWRPAWAMSCRLRVGVMRVSLHEWAQFETGDVLFVQRAAVHAQETLKADLFIARMKRPLYRVLINNDKVQIMDDEDGIFMDEAEAQPHAGKSAEVRLLSQIEFELNFWVGSRRLGWSELKALQPGSVLSLGRAVADTEVQLEADGQRLGRGRLVVLGSQLGVLLTQISAVEPAGE